jgi:hypothetical protein
VDGDAERQSASIVTDFVSEIVTESTFRARIRGFQRWHAACLVLLDERLTVAVPIHHLVKCNNLESSS